LGRGDFSPDDVELLIAGSADDLEHLLRLRVERHAATVREDR
jgi:hypothetical protein